MSILIFGSTGFIGKNLVSFLQTNYVVNEISLRDVNWKNKINNQDVFINLIGKAHDNKGIAKAEDFYFANVELTKQIFDTFVNSNAKILIHISSLAALEELESEKALDEEANSNPQSFYGKSKRAAEEWLLEQSLPSNKKVIILRPPMVHGPGDKGNLGLLYKLISKGIPYPLASFDNKRSFISIDNLSFFVKEIIEKQYLLQSGIYHITDDEPISTMQIINVIKKVESRDVMNLSIPKFIVKGLAMVGDVIPIPLNSLRLKKMTSNLILSNQKIKTALNIKQLPLSAEEGIIKTIKSFKIGS
ncbi:MULTISPECIES: NAD-dependent epimerase/dehydratase family protein [unclassified Empedobacter]|uniref:NAD-dependent epimerase/dehydratase family protein n=1 Tax=unclassified Empedobacter TaxID=2643773 RepID=UPI0025C361B4|nr:MULTISPECIES: NAD-dependent epimerase/dehydratase family protein [unclassified Empedobacter]